MITHEIYMASDHAGINLRLELAAELREAGHIVHDLGPEAAERVDYPDFAEKLALAMKPVADARGVLVCGSGIGISIAANRFPWVRCALCHDVTTATLCRQHNDANVIALGERLIGPTTASDALKAFLATEFEGGRHAGRVDKLSALNT
ncbi:MAG: ribose 5-phosphate isomerase B [Alphaproteobacteria bacterium]|nr:ribose 5-phosphate isomerase B [Alphaproteobacteria bacterium]